MLNVFCVTEFLCLSSFCFTKICLRRENISSSMHSEYSELSKITLQMIFVCVCVCIVVFLSLCENVWAVRDCPVGSVWPRRENSGHPPLVRLDNGRLLNSFIQ